MKLKHVRIAASKITCDFVQAASVFCAPLSRVSVMASSGSGDAFEPGFRGQWQRMISDALWVALVHLGVGDAADLAYSFASQDEAREWAVLQQCGGDSDRFVIAWQLCMSIVDRDFSVVDKVLRLEHQRTRGAAPKAMPTSSRTHDPQPRLERPVSVKRRREAITDSLTGSGGVY